MCRLRSSASRSPAGDELKRNPLTLALEIDAYMYNEQKRYSRSALILRRVTIVTRLKGIVHLRSG